MKNAEPKLLTTIYDFVDWYMSRTERFPKPLRVTLGDRIDNKLIGILELTVRARYSKNPTKYLSALNLELESLRFLSRLARSRNGLQAKQFEYVARCIDEIGRQIGGWIKHRRMATNEDSQKPASESLGI
ncbi:MAG: diversity-generating retroelement protein Avd [Fimbriimonadia bacterium]|nr:diversity-generating retroelement protein Avd [Fimbriimonadia bacterium]